jgi:hypothetical protein
MVIIIVPELEFDDVELAEAVVPILGGLSLLAGSADPGDEPPRNKKIARTEAKHRNLTSRLNVLSSHTRQGPLTALICFPKKTLFPQTAASMSPPVIQVRMPPAIHSHC